jgi:hypothetical protein
MRDRISGVNVVSFSGGRTSAFLVHLMEQERRKGAEVHYVFMDTGAEHPKTYEFIRNIVNVWGIPLVCIRMEAKAMGKGVSYSVVDVNDIKPDLVPFRDMLRKYGAPDASRPHCSNKMKERPFRKYCLATFGKDYTTWLGIRADEPNRLGKKDGIRFLAELTDASKQDILNWWSEQPFDLGISEHLGNCVFCVKKALGKVALAARDEFGMLLKFGALVEGNEVRTEGLKDPEKSRKMYRGHQTLSEVASLFPELTRDELFDKLKMARAFDTGSCAESCEVFKVGIE